MEVFERGIKFSLGADLIEIWPETIVFGLGVLVVLLVFLLWRSKKAGCRADAPAPVKKGPSRVRVAALLLACGAADAADLPSGVLRCSGAGARVAAYLGAGVNPGPFLTCMSTHVKGALTPTPQKKGKRPRGLAREKADPNLGSTRPRTASKNAEARRFYKSHKAEARRRYTERTGKPWPEGPDGRPQWAEHPRPLKDGGAPLFVEPGVGPDSNALHRANGDHRRWGAMGPAEKRRRAIEGESRPLPKKKERGQ